MNEMGANRNISCKELPLSKIQEQFWILANLSHLDTAYNIPLIYRIKGNLNIDLFKSALNSVLDNHVILRARIVLTNNIPELEIDNKTDINYFYNITEIQSDYSTSLFNEYVMAEVHKPFMINGGQLTRVSLFLFNDIIILSIIFHHIIIDLQSKNIFINELSKTYNNLIEKKEVSNQLQSKQYFEFTAWQNNWLLSADADKMRAKWKDVLYTIEDQIDLPYQFPLAKKSDQTGKRIMFDISPDLSGKIDKFSTENNITPFVFLLSSYGILLTRICNQKKVVIGVPFTNRRQEEYSNTIGCFVNILPVVLECGNHLSIIDLIKQVRLIMLKIHRIQEIPYLELNSEFNRIQQNPLFKVGYTFEGPVDLNLEGIEAESIVIERDGAQLDLFLTLWNSSQQYFGFWEYNSDKFTIESINRFNDILNQIIVATLNDSSEFAQNIEILTKHDRIIIDDFNNTKCDYENDICIHRKFEVQADQTPDAPALISNKTILSYQETDVHINRLANYIISKGVRPGDVVAISCERSIEMMIGILSILKAGACYLPIQIDNPSDRNSEIIGDSQPRLILTTIAGEINIVEKDLLVFIDNILEVSLSSNSSRPEILLKSNGLAYILYTSGSTGIPKGTLIEHHSVLNRIGWMQKKYPLSSSDTLIQKTPITFDVSVWELFWWFFNGSKLVLLSINGEKDPITILDYIHRYSVTQIHFVPSMFSPFLQYVRQNDQTKKLDSLKNIFLSGEALPAQYVAEFNQLRKFNKLPALVNLYGPTEATVDVSYFNCPNELSDTDNIYIGRPIDNTNLFIVNQNLKIQPVGVKGELLITGENLSRGYLNKTELTRKSFVNFTKPGGEVVRAYKTGDIAVLNPISEIKYLDRMDNQVKIRGMRIELSEIEFRLSQHPKLSQVAVIVDSEGAHKRILAYISTKSGEPIFSDELVGFISKKVPSYMVPLQFINIDTIPLTSNGKLDRKALPKPIKEMKPVSVISNTSSACESELINIWKEILQVKNISITENFFDIGGNSLLAINLALKISEHFGKNVTVVSVLEYPNIREYCKYLKTMENDSMNDSPNSFTISNGKRKNIARKNRSRLD